MGAMARAVAVLACCLVSFSAGLEDTAWEVATGGTIGKVIKLMKEILEKSTEDANHDRELFAKFRCYCDTNTDEKTKSIETLTAQISLLGSELGELKADTGKRSTENGELAPMMAENEESRKGAQELRDKEHESFVAEEADLTAASGQMDQAIATLSAIGADQTVSGSNAHAKFMAGKGASLVKLKAHVQEALKAAVVFATTKQRKTLTAFIQTTAKAARSGKAPFGGTYDAQSGEIVGILKNMRDTFEANLKSAKDKEASALLAHEEFMKVKTSNFDEMKATYDNNEAIMGSNDDSVASKSSSKIEAETTLADDTEFLATLTKMCKDTTKQYELRKMIRSGEASAVSQAIAILNSESAVESFGKTKTTGDAAFLQVEAKTRRHRDVTAVDARSRAKHYAQHQAKRLKSMRLAKVAVMLETGSPFTKVLEAVNDMIAIIKKEETADDEQLSWCNSERETGDNTVADKVSGIEALEGEINQLDDDVNNVDTGLKAQLKEQDEQLRQNREDQKEAKKERKAENKKYQAEILNLQEAQTILKKATKVLQKYYEFLHKATGPHHYDQKEGKDSGGANIRKLEEASVEELEQACSDEPKCMGFNTAGYLKSAIEPEDKWYDTEESLYVKVFDSDNPVSSALLAKRQATKEDPAPPDVWADENEIGGGDKAGDVVSTLEEITTDTRKEEEATHMDEEANQHSFEDEMDKLKGEEKTCLDTIVSLEETVAQKEADIEAKHLDKEQTHKEMKAMERYLEKIKPGCDFITENIDTRKENRGGEIEALEGAIEKLKSTPAFKEAEASDEKDALGECAVKCSNRDALDCVACVSGTTVSGYCAGHPDHPDC